MAIKQFLFGILFTAVSCFFFAGCSKDNSTVQNSITFKGKVWVGHMDTTTNILIADGLVKDAVISCTNYPGSVKTGNDGSYSLDVQAVRTFSGPNSDTYTLQASYNGYDATMSVFGKPGDTIDVKDFVLYQHTIVSAPRRPQ